VNKKLEQVCEEKFKLYYTHSDEYSQGSSKTSFEVGFQAAIESEAVKGLVEFAEEVAFDKRNEFYSEAKQALKPFEKEGE
jgi:hypothetical protein